MNMEDRLREAFEQEAEQLHAPHGSPDTAIRRGRRRRASNLIGGAALVLTLVGGTAAGLQLLGNTDEPEQGNLASAIETDQTVDESTVQTSTAGVIDFKWEKVTLPKPDGPDVWNIQVAATDDGFVAVGTGYTPSAGESILVWRSTDGTDWTLASTSPAFDGPIDTLLTTADGFVAVVRSFDGSNDSTTVYSSSDGATWTRADVDLSSLDYNQYLSFTGAASGNGATVIAGALQTEPDEPPVVFEEAGIALQQNNRDGSFTVTDLVTGEVITVIETDAVYGGGPSVRGPDGEVIAKLSEEDVEAGYETGSLGTLEIEQDGVRVTIDYATGMYIATDIASGTLIIEGSMDELYGIPQIVIVHPDTGETILDIDMDAFYRAQDDAWNDYDYNYRPETDLIILATSDGATWNRIDLAVEPAEELGVGGVGFGPDGFLLSTYSYGPDRAGQSVWQSSDGQDWELLSSSDEPGEGSIVSTGDAYYRFSYRNGPAIDRSTDGVSWTPVHTPASRGTYFNSLSAGGLGVVAIGQDQDDYYGPPVVIAKDGRTLVVDGETGRITVTEDATGKILTTIELDVYAVEAPAQIIEDTENGTIAITDIDGVVVMEFTEDEANAASEESYPDEEYSIPETAIAFSRDGQEWFTATTVGLEVAYAQSVAVGADSIVIVGEPGYYDTPDSIDYPPDSIDLPIEPGGETTATTVVYGTDLNGSPVETYVWVGRPR